MSEPARHQESDSANRLAKLGADVATDPENTRWVNETREMIRDGSILATASTEEDVLRHISALRASID